PPFTSQPAPRVPKPIASWSVVLCRAVSCVLLVAVSRDSSAVPCRFAFAERTAQQAVCERDDTVGKGNARVIARL
uniref:Uncharacterized protein n=1 Tax=Anopheles albimanus TaxID=7167 RepID=A0A182FXH2_ANOAL